MFELALVKHRLAGNIKLIAFWPWRTVASSIPLPGRDLSTDGDPSVLRGAPPDKSWCHSGDIPPHDKLRPRTEYCMSSNGIVVSICPSLSLFCSASQRVTAIDMPKSLVLQTLLEMLIFFMGLFEDSRSKFNGSGSIGMIVCQRKYSFVQRKRIFLYKTVGQFHFFPGA